MILCSRSYGRSVLETLDLAPSHEHISSVLTTSNAATEDLSATASSTSDGRGSRGGNSAIQPISTDDSTKGATCGIANVNEEEGDYYGKYSDENSEDEQERRRAGTITSRCDVDHDDESFDDTSSSHLVPSQDHAQSPNSSMTTTTDSELIACLSALLTAATCAASAARPSPQAGALTSSITAPHGQLSSPRFSFNASSSTSSASSKSASPATIVGAEPPPPAVEWRSIAEENSSSNGAISTAGSSSSSSSPAAPHTPPLPPSSATIVGTQSTTNGTSSVNSSYYPPLDLVDDGPFGDNQESSLNFLKMPPPEPPLFQPLPPAPPQAAPAAIGTVKLVGRLLFALHGANDNTVRSNNAEGKYTPLVSETTENAMKATLKSAVEDLLALLDSSPLADSVLEVVEAEVLTAVAAHFKWQGLPLAEYISKPQTSQASAASASNTSPGAATTGSITAPQASSASSSSSSSSLVEQASNGATSSEPTSWFSAVTKAIKASANPFAGPESRHLADGGGLLLATHLSDLDSGNNSVSIGGGPGAEEWAKQGSDFAKPSTPLAELRRALRLVLALTHLCDQLTPKAHKTTKATPPESSPSSLPCLWYHNLLSASSLEDLHGGIGGVRAPSGLSSVRVTSY